MSAGVKVPKPASAVNGVAPKVVGPNVQGHKEEYQLVRRLQSALFGGVYEAKGLSTGRDFAIKVLHKSELAKAQESNSIEFCEVPLSEIRFEEYMRGDDHVMDSEEHFEDDYCFYVVFELAKGGDLLEALKQKPHGFDEPHAAFLIRQATQGLAFLHKRQVAMQDVSLENMLLHVEESTGQFQVKVCDPGQAVVFELGQNGEEQMVNFRGLVGKSFRPPELHDQRAYLATKVDSWCLGWSTFYLLTAQPLFMSADPAQQDADWHLFRQRDFAALFRQKANLCSQTGLDFILSLLHIDPKRRLSVTDALSHPWLKDPGITPVFAPKELLPDSLQKSLDVQQAEVVREEQAERAGAGGLGGAGGGAGAGGAGGGGGGSAAPAAQGGGTRGNSAQGQSPQSRSTAPAKTLAELRQQPHSPCTLAPRVGDQDRRPQLKMVPGRLAQVSTAHSPAPMLAGACMSLPAVRRAPKRASSPLGRVPLSGTSTSGQQYPSRSGSSRYGGPMPTQADGEYDESRRGRALQFRAEGDLGRWPERQSPGPASQPGAGVFQFSPAPSGGGSSPLQPRVSTGLATPSSGRQALSPPRGHGNAIVFPRSISPVRSVGGSSDAPVGLASTATIGALPVRSSDSGGFSWNQAPTLLSPRVVGIARTSSGGGLAVGSSATRTSSPVAATATRVYSPAPPSNSHAATTYVRSASPLGTAYVRSTTPAAPSLTRPFLPTGYAWSADPPSPKASPRSYSPGRVASMSASPGKAAGSVGVPSAVPRWLALP